jgi:hypothetical protein
MSIDELKQNHPVIQLLALIRLSGSAVWLSG